ncbi:hypothetical protein BLOT_013409 [Blomia tropicalis]|nr:hypothetical protein BLOT_013409 [Blomia tropicalis]
MDNWITLLYIGHGLHGFLIKTSADNRRKPKDTQHLSVDWNKHASKQSNYPSESHNKIMALFGPRGDDDGGGAH